MKRVIKTIVLAGTLGIFSISANAQNDNAKTEKTVLDKMGDSKSIEYSIKPDEIKDVLVVEVKLGATLVIKSSQQGLPQVKTDASNGGQIVTSGTGNGASGGIVTNSNSITGAPADVSQAYANSHRIVVSAKTNWTLKKDGKPFASGADGLEYMWLSGRPVSVKNDPDTAPIFEPGTYVITVKCIQKTVCDDKLSLTLISAPLPDPSNLGPL